MAPLSSKTHVRRRSGTPATERKTGLKPRPAALRHSSESGTSVESKTLRRMSLASRAMSIPSPRSNVRQRAFRVFGDRIPLSKSSAGGRLSAQMRGRDTCGRTSPDDLSTQRSSEVQEARSCSVSQTSLFHAGGRGAGGDYCNWTFGLSLTVSTKKRNNGSQKRAPNTHLKL